MSRLVMHVDLDAFFAAVEQRDNPPWRGLPLVVGAEPGRRGVVATCSYEARRYGVHSAMPISAAAGRLPPETIYMRPSMNRYARISRQIMDVSETISPLVEKVSIDEAYLDVTGLERLMGPPEIIGRLTKKRIREAVGLTASVGIGPNRLIAKLASDFQTESWAGRPVRLIGVRISGWDEAQQGVQQDLFDARTPDPSREQESLDATLDAIRDKFGRGTIQRGLNRRNAGVSKR